MPDLVRISTLNSESYQIVAFFLIDIIFAPPIYCVRKGEICKTRASGNTRQQIWLLQLANRSRAVFFFKLIRPNFWKEQTIEKAVDLNRGPQS